MAEKEIIVKEKVDNTGLFKFSDFYEYAHSWFKGEDYGVVEEKYAEKVSGNSKELDIEWKATKKLSDYFKIEQAVKFEVRNLVDVEVEIEGKKKKMNQGKVSVEIKGAIIKDQKSEWEKSPFYRFMRDVYNKYVIPQRVDAIEDKIKADVQKFKDDLKAYLELMGRR